MKILKIDSDKGYFSTDGKNWIAIDEITKEGILSLLNNIIENDVELDEYNECLLKNPAHRIIYENIYKNFEPILNNKSTFEDDCANLYKDAFIKYQEQS
ncbi:hypothetical protein Q4530_17460 [Colwellia sp. 1_MG-2023]|jgi:hypothetical protein|uniref:hypothetical protein n=1 Tax=unclassified Colwellia TaxID=196834 RepID=UPI001C098C5B|nr:MULTISPECIES: hypothetical protein [unclassified Colwellia]MBU2926277.1 hypothetical protein [Colwellia sp. C2M11]MDO6654162.1 hypothetical protein [Colwellia sp. 3_MG-2023]MDO6667206.1 hypothetical protein [Colwellia sp. 2_MG-2023]MDO6691560.1 hypothetical protein [Colwellia sp. 1_MG-2023]